jgi:ribosomal protein RSM22 (predicted rRNA methylase)
MLSRHLQTIFFKTLGDYLKSNYLKKTKSSAPWNVNDTKYFAKGVLKLNQLFTKEGLKKDYFTDPIARSGYLAYFYPINALKAVQIFEKHEDKLTRLPKTLRVADIGAGPLSLSLAIVLYSLSLKERAPQTIEIHSFERNAKIAQDGKAIIENLIQNLNSPLKVKITNHQVNLRSMDKRKQPDFHILLWGNVLNEIKTRDTQIRLVENILQNQKSKNLLSLFMEPGTKKATRDLQNLRDDLIEMNDAQVLGPCLHQEKCPLNLVSKGDWCHFFEDWDRPKWIEEFDRVTKLKKTSLVYSYLLTRFNSTEDMETTSNKRFLAITNAMRLKKSIDVVGCGASGHVRFRLFREGSSPVNKHISQTERGDVFDVPTYEPKDVFAIDEHMVLKSKDGFAKLNR